MKRLIFASNSKKDVSDYPDEVLKIVTEVYNKSKYVPWDEDVLSRPYLYGGIVSMNVRGWDYVDDYYDDDDDDDYDDYDYDDDNDLTRFCDEVEEALDAAGFDAFVQANMQGPNGELEVLNN